MGRNGIEMETSVWRVLFERAADQAYDGRASTSSGIEVRVLYYSLTQQIVRQDPGYWTLLCAGLRPDRNVNLV